MKKRQIKVAFDRAWADSDHSELQKAPQAGENLLALIVEDEIVRKIEGFGAGAVAEAIYGSME